MTEKNKEENRGEKVAYIDPPGTICEIEDISRKPQVVKGDELHDTAKPNTN